MVAFFVPQSEVRPKAVIECPKKASVGEKVQFSGEKSFDKDGKIVTFQWKFGDGTKAEGVRPTHTYQEPGEYRVSLVVVDNDGLEDETSCKIQIENDPNHDEIVISELTFKSHKTNGGLLPLDNIALEDLNQDGEPDLIVTTSKGGQVMVFRGQGNGQFCSAINLSIGGDSESLAVADINGDGTFDLIFAHPEEKELTILAGRATGSFEDLVSIGVDDPPSELATGDFNRDGFDELAVSSYSANKVRIFWGGKGMLNKDTYTLSVKTPSSLISGDFDQDGDLDLAIQSRGKLLLAKGQGNDAFEKPEEMFRLPFETMKIVQGDFNQDDMLDIVAFKEGEDSILIFKGESKGVFEKALEHRTKLKLKGVAVGDVNGDGIPDIVATGRNSNKVTVLISKVE